MPHLLWIILFLPIVIGNDSIVGKNVAVSEVMFDAPVEDIQWCKADNTVVLLKTTSGHLYKSVDSGAHWSELTDSLNMGSPHKNYEGSEAHAGVETILVNPTDRDRVIILTDRHTHFVSSNGASSFRTISFQGGVHNWVFHPSHPDWALVSSWSISCEHPDMNESCVHSLYVTKDYGKSFKLVESYVVQFSWGENNKNNESWIYFTHFTNKRGNQSRDRGWSDDINFSVSRDQGDSTQDLLAGGNKYLINHGFIFVAKIKDYHQQLVSLLVSTDEGNSFKEAVLPVPVKERAYTILDTSENAIMIHVNHGAQDGTLDTGHVYISDSEGINYSLSLPNNIRAASGETEFDRVASMDGVYIANFLDHTRGSDSEYREGELNSMETQTDRRHRVKSKSKSEQLVRSVITFDKGGMWSYIQPPRIDSRGNSIQCVVDGEADCFLHLHGITQYKQYAPFYSTESALGMIMGTGNIGSHLRFEPSEINTYLSRDGGKTWIEAHKGAYIYEFGDHGGLIVMADDLRETSQVVFSWNEGQSWYDFQLSSTSFQVDNVVIEPKASALEFLIYGTRNGKGVLYHLDFSTLGQAKCQGIESADSVSSDYETWSPSDKGNRCILGREIVYTRRKQTSDCYNGHNMKRPKTTRVCTCTANDYECEIGFSRSIGQLECKPTDPNMTHEGCTSSSYFMAKAYRKIPGDVCQGGWVPPLVAVPCSSHAPFSLSTRFLLIIILLSVAVLLLITYISSNPNIKVYLQNTGLDGFYNVRYAPLNYKTKTEDDRFIDSAQQQDGTLFESGNRFDVESIKPENEMDGSLFKFDDEDLLQ